MEKKVTDDGSITYFNEEFDQLYHSSSGAAEEAREKYAIPLKIAEFSQGKKEVKILDFCYGLGYNTAASIDAIREVNKECQITVVALENDQAILDASTKIDAPFHSFHALQAAAQSHSYASGGLSLTILLGDAAQTILEVSEFDFDFILFDPFSPAKCPHLWTEDIFTECYIRLKQEGKLATYSCARKVRDAMKHAGFVVKDGPCVRRRGPSTICIKK